MIDVKIYRPHARRILNAFPLILFEYEVAVPNAPYKAFRFDCVGLDPWNLNTADIRVLEIKSSRSDFASDKKWKSYLDYCTHFAFLAPQGVVDPLELPPGIGLFEVGADGTLYSTKLWRKQKAPVSPEHRQSVLDRLSRRAMAALLREVQSSSMTTQTRIGRNKQFEVTLN